MKNQFREVWLGVRKPQGECSSWGCFRESGKRKPGREGFCVSNWVLQLRDIVYSR